MGTSWLGGGAGPEEARGVRDETSGDPAWQSRGCAVGGLVGWRTMRAQRWFFIALVAGACAKAPTSAPASHERDAAPAAPANPFCPRREADPPRTIVKRPCGVPRAV